MKNTSSQKTEQWDHEIISRVVSTRIGDIHIRTREVMESTPVIFLHGVYFDLKMWRQQADKLIDQTVIFVDMPLHGESRKIWKTDWDMDDCAGMLLDILDQLQLESVIAIGHSWGSMTILRAAHAQPGRFAAIGLCNMPFRSTSYLGRLAIRVLHLLLLARRFYNRQVAKALFGRESLRRDPGLMERLQSTMDLLSDANVRVTDERVRIKATDTTHLLKTVAGFALALKGEEDYVPVPDCLDTTIVPGGHVSPLEEPELVSGFVERVITLAGAR